MDIIREWIITIVSVIIFITFLEILIPNSNNKRYINVVVGLLIMIVILKPLIYFMEEEMNLGEKILQTSNYLEYETTKKRVSNNDYFQTEAVIQLYKQYLREQMKNRLENMTDYLVADIQLVIDDKEEDGFGVIQEIDIIFENLSQISKTTAMEKGETRDIKIDVSLSKNNNTVETQSIWINNEEELIKDDFSIYYNLPRDNINIYILKDK